VRGEDGEQRERELNPGSGGVDEVREGIVVDGGGGTWTEDALDEGREGGRGALCAIGGRGRKILQRKGGGKLERRCLDVVL
jgi:hypothetical protein